MRRSWIRCSVTTEAERRVSSYPLVGERPPGGDQSASGSAVSRRERAALVE